MCVCHVHVRVCCTWRNASLIAIVDLLHKIKVDVGSKIFLKRTKRQTSLEEREEALKKLFDKGGIVIPCETTITVHRLVWLRDDFSRSTPKHAYLVRIHSTMCYCYDDPFKA